VNIINILILSCSTGGGHNAAARAVEEMLKRKKASAEVFDALSLAGEGINKNICRSYEGITTKHPKAFGLIYHAGDLFSGIKIKSPIYLANSLYSSKLAAYIEENEIKAVVATHLFAAQAMSRIRNAGKSAVPYIFIMTDYTSFPFIWETKPNYLIAPSEELIEECVKKGTEKSKIMPYGIPVHPDFQIKVPKKEARSNLGLPLDKLVYLIMCGSMGFGDIEELAKKTVSIYGGNIRLVILCGNNKALFNSLTDTLGQEESVMPLQFTDKVSLYMDAADVVFTKPGGLTSTEAAVKNIPIIHTRPIPGCEERNALFFSSRGMSFYSSDVVTQLFYAYKLACDESYRSKMKQAQKKYINPNACENICDLAIDLAQSTEYQRQQNS
jgi:processive 1,2-diacylglycerol beta-glucosyltransferase